MKRSGFIRRVVILIVFAWLYSHLVLQDGLFIQDPQMREYLRWLLYAALAWGIITLLADRLKPSKGSGGEEKHDE